MTMQILDHTTNMGLISGDIRERGSDTGGQLGLISGGAEISPTTNSLPSSAGSNVPRTSSAPPLSTPAIPQRQVTDQGIQIGSYAPNAGIYGAYQTLFNPITSAVQKGYGQLGQLGQQFSQEAGAFRTFEGLGGNEILQNALRPNADIGPAKELAGAAYTGPTGLEGVAGGRQADLQGLQSSARTLQAQNRALGQPGGLIDLIGQYAPSLTAGERRFELQNLEGQPGFRQAVGQARTDISGLYGNLYGAMGQAQAVGQARTGQEADIQQKARDFLTAQKSGIVADIHKQIDAAAARDAATLAQFQKFRQSGDWRDLVGMNPQTINFDPSAFNTPTMQTLAQGQRAMAGVLAQFPGISSIPLMGLGISKHGRQAYEFDPDWEAANKERYSVQDWNDIKAAAIQRQQALEAAGFAQRYGSKKRPAKYTRETGTQFGELLPLYEFGGQGAFRPDSPESFISASQQELPNLQNMSTDDQKRVFNTIDDILGQIDKLDPKANPFHAVKLMGEVGRYLDQEQAILAQRRGALSAGEQTQKENLDAARKKYEKAKKNKQMMNIIMLVSNIAGGGAPSYLPGAKQTIQGSFPLKNKGGPDTTQQIPATQTA